MKKNFMWVILCLCAAAGCKRDNEDTEVQPVVQGYKIYVGNEGNFGSSNADISYIDETGTIHNDVYQTLHGMPLGDVLQSITLEGGKLYAVLNNSNKLTILRASDYEHLHTIDGIDYPRYVHHLNTSKAYVSSGAGSGVVYPLDKTNYILGSPIAVGNGPENMTVSNGKLFVCNSGGWGVDNTITVIDTDTDTAIDTITVSDVPVDAVTDANGDVWVLCKGQTLYDETWTVIGHTDARLYRIDAINFEVINYYTLGANGDHPYSMSIANDGQEIFVANGDLYHITLSELIPEVLIEGSFGTVDVSTRNGELWLTSYSDFVNPSTVYEYTRAGQWVAQYTAGMGANGAIAQ